MTEKTTYSRRFQEAIDVQSYEHTEYAVESYSSCIWKWQRPIVEQLVQETARKCPAQCRLLDFACGTGRVLSCIEPLVNHAEGIDISESMVALARSKCSKATFKVGDILSQPELLNGPYDLITAFRFLLNVEPALRQRILHKLRASISLNGTLLINVHGNSRSLRHPAILWRRWRERSSPSGAMLNEMSPDETKALLRASGFQVVREFGFGMLPPTLYRTPLRRPAAAMDKLFVGENIWSNVSIDLLFVCEPC